MLLTVVSSRILESPNFIIMSALAQSQLRPEMPMAEVMSAYPGARRALFAKYHIGGCRSCGFSDAETLADVCKRNENLDPQEVIDHLEASREQDNDLQIRAGELAGLMKAADLAPKLLDVRSREEHEAVKLPNSQFLTEELMREIFGTWNKETPIVLYCHTGSRGLDLAAYFRGHGFNDTKCLAGGIDAWSLEVDPSVRRYSLEID
jgi:rhodanese-related sulfurtransferase